MQPLNRKTFVFKANSPSHYGDHRIIWVEMDLKAQPAPAPLPWAGLPLTSSGCPGPLPFLPGPEHLRQYLLKPCENHSTHWTDTSQKRLLPLTHYLVNIKILETWESQDTLILHICWEIKSLFLFADDSLTCSLIIKIRKWGTPRTKNCSKAQALPIVHLLIHNRWYMRAK